MWLKSMGGLKTNLWIEKVYLNITDILANINEFGKIGSLALYILQNFCARSEFTNSIVSI